MNHSASGAGVAETDKDHKRDYAEDMCITSSHLREAEEDEEEELEQDLIEDGEDEEEEEDINGDSEVSDTESRTMRRHDRVQVSF